MSADALDGKRAPSSQAPAVPRATGDGAGRSAPSRQELHIFRMLHWPWLFPRRASADRMIITPDPPVLVIIAGPNGAGKSTIAPKLLSRALGISELVNADTIAAGLSALQPETVALAAGKLMLRRIAELAARRVNFAFETTLASRGLRTTISAMQQDGYRVQLLFLALKHPDIAIRRVAERVKLGGHAVPEEIIRRRYEAGLQNFFGIYSQLVGEWFFYDNSAHWPPLLIAAGTRDNVDVKAPQIWGSLVRRYR
jgi:predicted ABC-type ATPase